MRALGHLARLVVPSHASGVTMFVIRVFVTYILYLGVN